MLWLQRRVLAILLTVGLLLGGCSVDVQIVQTPAAVDEVAQQPSATLTGETTVTAEPTGTATTPTSEPTATQASTPANARATPTATRATAAPSGASRPRSTGEPPTATPTQAPVPTDTPAPTRTPTPTATTTACANEWFTDVPEAGCPTEAAVVSFTAFQPFQNGYMFWFETPGRYVILYQSSSSEGFAIVHDPLTIYRDTSGEVSAPEGLMAPVSGFGLVWRGDVFEDGQGYRDLLGWATVPESGYDSRYQCRAGPTPHWTCYFSGPQGQLFGISSLGTWFVENE